MYKINNQSWLKYFYFLITDIISITLTSIIIPYLYTKQFSIYYKGLQLILTSTTIIYIIVSEEYNYIFRRGYLKEAKKVIIQITSVFLFAIVLIFFSKTSINYSRVSLLFMWVVTILFTYILRIVTKKMVLLINKKHLNPRYVLVVSDKKNAEYTLKSLQKNIISDIQIPAILILDNNDMLKEICGIPVVENAEVYIKDHTIDEVLINTFGNLNSCKHIIKLCETMGKVVHFVLEETFQERSHETIENVGEFTVMTKGINLVSTKQVLIKRFTDICGSIVGLIITGIAFIFIAPIIYIKSPGPIFFSQTRIGKNGRKFKIYKFRSMYMDAEKRKADLMKDNKMQGFMFKIDNDPRIIKGIGNFIRKTSIDELPQMWNVLKNDMSLVGTRPPTLDEFEKYNYHHKLRLAIKPGITGMWQVCGRSNITDFEEVVALDKKYIENWSISLDIKIIIKTILVVFARKGSV